MMSLLDYLVDDDEQSPGEYIETGTMEDPFNVRKVPLNRLVSIYMMSSYLYYHRYESIITDEEYDYVCKRLHDDYDHVTHNHKVYLDRNSLKAGTAYQMKAKDYPTVTRVAAEQWARDEFIKREC